MFHSLSLFNISLLESGFHGDKRNLPLLNLARCQLSLHQLLSCSREQPWMDFDIGGKKKKKKSIVIPQEHKLSWLTVLKWQCWPRERKKISGLNGDFPLLVFPVWNSPTRRESPTSKPDDLTHCLPHGASFVSKHLSSCHRLFIHQSAPQSVFWRKLPFATIS